MASQPNRFKFLVSACLAGINCTYNGKNNLDPAIKKIFISGDCLLVCPEVMGGLPIPRPPIELVGGDGRALLFKKAKAMNAGGADVTKECTRGAKLIVRLAKRYGVKQAILKSNSPCCGIGKIYDGTFTETLKSGNGILAAALVKSGIKVCSEKNLLLKTRLEDGKIKATWGKKAAYSAG